MAISRGEETKSTPAETKLSIADIPKAIVKEIIQTIPPTSAAQSSMLTSTFFNRITRDYFVREIKKLNTFSSNQVLAYALASEDQAKFVIHHRNSLRAESMLTAPQWEQIKTTFPNLVDILAAQNLIPPPQRHPFGRGCP